LDDWKSLIKWSSIKAQELRTSDNSVLALVTYMVVHQECVGPSPPNHGPKAVNLVFLSSPPPTVSKTTCVRKYTFRWKKPYVFVRKYTFRGHKNLVFSKVYFQTHVGGAERNSQIGKMKNIWRETKWKRKR
jgi:hypothetical protein